MDAVARTRARRARVDEDPRTFDRAGRIDVRGAWGMNPRRARVWPTEYDAERSRRSVGDVISTRLGGTLFHLRGKHGTYGISGPYAVRTVPDLPVRAVRPWPSARFCWLKLEKPVRHTKSGCLAVTKFRSFAVRSQMGRESSLENWQFSRAVFL
jgi:hypothetical protein